MKKKKIFIISLGCPRNIVDSEVLIANSVLSGKYELSYDIENSDIVIINTCAFLNSAVAESYNEMKKAIAYKKKGYVKKIIVCGCLPERFQQEIKDIEDIDLIRGIDLYDDPDLFYNERKKILFGNRDKLYEKSERALIVGNHYEYIKIAEGCSHRCSFCLIPDIKGELRSKKIKDVLCEAEKLLQSGVKELIVIAQDTTDYGKDWDGRSHLLELLSKLDQLGFKWIRVHYLNPETVDENFVERFLSFNSVIAYFDVPVQHVSPRILKLMHRKSDLTNFYKGLRQIKAAGGILRTNFIIGFPSETENDLNMIIDFLQEYQVERAVFFPYSDERNIIKSLSLFPIQENIVKERMEKLENIVTDNIYKAFPIGKKETVVIDDHKNGYFIGRTFRDSPNIDLTIKIRGKGIKTGDFCKAKLYIKNGNFMGAV
jgi:ribosomal protein S12 methylthiotransferase